ncbi:hypothetical protein MMC10_006083 [Thelotrema lepadinum]|nr:hypothetical protein [Thelotrema lepadinum]
MDWFDRPPGWISLLRSLFDVNGHKPGGPEIWWRKKREFVRLSEDKSQRMASGNYTNRELFLLQGDDLIDNILSGMNTDIVPGRPGLVDRKYWLGIIEQVKRLQRGVDPGYKSERHRLYTARDQRAGTTLPAEQPQLRRSPIQAQENGANNQESPVQRLGLQGETNAAISKAKSGGTSETPRDFFRRLAAESDKRREDERGVFKQFAAKDKELDPLAKEILENLDNLDTTGTSRTVPLARLSSRALTSMLQFMLGVERDVVLVLHERSNGSGFGKERDLDSKTLRSTPIGIDGRAGVVARRAVGEQTTLEPQLEGTKRNDTNLDKVKKRIRHEAETSYGAGYLAKSDPSSQSMPRTDTALEGNTNGEGISSTRPDTYNDTEPDDHNVPKPQTDSLKLQTEPRLRSQTSPEQDEVKKILEKARNYRTVAELNAERSMNSEKGSDQPPYGDPTRPFSSASASATTRFEGLESTSAQATKPRASSALVASSSTDEFASLKTDIEKTRKRVAYENDRLEYIRMRKAQLSNREGADSPGQSAEQSEAARRSRSTSRVKPDVPLLYPPASVDGIPDSIARSLVNNPEASRLRGRVMSKRMPSRERSLSNRFPNRERSISRSPGTATLNLHEETLEKLMEKSKSPLINELPEDFNPAEEIPKPTLFPMESSPALRDYTPIIESKIVEEDTDEVTESHQDETHNTNSVETQEEPSAAKASDSDKKEQAITQQQPSPPPPLPNQASPVDTGSAPTSPPGVQPQQHHDQSISHPPPLPGDPNPPSRSASPARSVRFSPTPPSSPPKPPHIPPGIRARAFFAERYPISTTIGDNKDKGDDSDKNKDEDEDEDEEESEPMKPPPYATPPRGILRSASRRFVGGVFGRRVGSKGSAEGGGKRGEGGDKERGMGGKDGDGEGGMGLGVEVRAGNEGVDGKGEGNGNGEERKEKGRKRAQTLGRDVLL